METVDWNTSEKHLTFNPYTMPINAKKMKALKKEYGTKKWENVYYALENKKKKKKK